MNASEFLFALSIFFPCIYGSLGNSFQEYEFLSYFRPDSPYVSVQDDLTDETDRGVLRYRKKSRLLSFPFSFQEQKPEFTNPLELTDSLTGVPFSFQKQSPKFMDSLELTDSLTGLPFNFQEQSPDIMDPIELRDSLTGLLSDSYPVDEGFEGRQYFQSGPGFGTDQIFFGILESGFQKFTFSITSIANSFETIGRGTPVKINNIFLFQIVRALQRIATALGSNSDAPGGRFRVRSNKEKKRNKGSSLSDETSTIRITSTTKLDPEWINPVKSGMRNKLKMGSTLLDKNSTTEQVTERTTPIKKLKKVKPSPDETSTTRTNKLDQEWIIRIKSGMREKLKKGTTSSNETTRTSNTNSNSNTSSISTTELVTKNTDFDIVTDSTTSNWQDFSEHLP